MKSKVFALAAALMLTVALVGCSSNRVDNSQSPTNSIRPSAAQPDGARESDVIDRDDDYDDDRKPDATPNGSDHVTGDGVLDDVGDAAGDLVDGAGDVVRDAGDAIGNAANNVGRAMH